MADIKKYCHHQPVIMLCANKSDLPNPQVDGSACRELAAQLGISFIETSAKSGTGISEAFESLVSQIISAKYVD